MLAYTGTYFWDDWFNYFGVSVADFRQSTGPFSGYNPMRVLLEGYLAENLHHLFRVSIFVLYPVKKAKTNDVHDYFQHAEVRQA